MCFPVEVFLTVITERMGLTEALMIIHYPGLTFDTGGIYFWAAIN